MSESSSSEIESGHELRKRKSKLKKSDNDNKDKDKDLHEKQQSDKADKGSTLKRRLKKLIHKTESPSPQVSYVNVGQEAAKDSDDEGSVTILPSLRDDSSSSKSRSSYGFAIRPTYRAMEDRNNEEIESGVEMLEDTIISSPEEHSEVDKNTLETKLSRIRNKLLEYEKILKPPDNKDKNVVSSIYSMRAFIISTIFFSIYYMFAFPPYIGGFMMGIVATMAVNSITEKIFRKIKGTGNKYGPESTKFKVPDYPSMPILEIPSAEEFTPMARFEGWINLYSQPYDPETYHLSNTTPVFIKIKGHTLWLFHPRNRVPRRAFYNEPKPKLKVHTCLKYNITGAKVSLLPNQLARTRYWSKKYPICLEFMKSPKNVKTREQQSTTSVHFMTSDVNMEEVKVPQFLTLSADQVGESVSGDTGSNMVNIKNEEVATKSEYTMVSEEDVKQHSTKHISLNDDGKNNVHRTLSQFIVSVRKVELIQLVKIALRFRNQLFVSKKKPFWLPLLQIWRKGKKPLEILPPSVLPPTVQSSELESDDIISYSGAKEVIKGNNTHLIMFARGSREKYDWFIRFEEAIKAANSANSNYSEFSRTDFPSESSLINTYKCENLEPSEVDLSEFSSMTSLNRSYVDEDPDNISLTSIGFVHDNTPKQGLDIRTPPMYIGDPAFVKYLGHFQQKHTKSEKMATEMWNNVDRTISNDCLWFSVLLGRILLGVIRDGGWTSKIREKIQKKCKSIRLPYYMDEITVTDLRLGDNPPLIHRASRPVLDDRGLWIDLDVTYEGLISVVITTKLDLMKLKQGDDKTKTTKPNEKTTQVGDKSLPAYNSELEDTAETTTTDEDHPHQDIQYLPSSSSGAPATTPSKRPPGKTFLKVVDKVAQTKIFQTATDNKFVKRAMAAVSQSVLRLQVDIRGLVGRIVLNIPNPPSDRLWISFREPPRLWLSAHPAFGERNVSSQYVTNWIEKKLCQELVKTLVMPNMDDITIPLLAPLVSDKTNTPGT